MATTPGVLVRMATRARDGCRPWTRIASFSQPLMTTSPAKLFTDKRVPRVTGTVWSVSGARGTRAAWVAAVDCATNIGPESSDQTTAAVATNIDDSSAPAVGDGGGAAEQFELTRARFDEICVQVTICGVFGECLTALRNGAVDRLQVL